MTTTDQSVRLQALDVTVSCIVQAPAGSGKTELLIQRALALLAVVEEPRQILSITFTNKAAAEMRRRLIQALTRARTEPEPPEDHAALTWRLARRALARHGEDLLRNPAQLAIRTIDGFCADLVRKMPWLSRFGGMPTIAADAESLYRTAVGNLLARLEQPGSVSDSLKCLLEHLDNDMAVVERMLTGLLAKRDQWLRHLPTDSIQLLDNLNAALEGICAEQLIQVRAAVPEYLVDELLFCARFAALHCPEDSPLRAAAAVMALPRACRAELPCWQALAELVVTGTGSVRKTVTKNQGFPATDSGRQAKDRMLKLLETMTGYPDLIAHLQQVKSLPVQDYSPEQRRLLEALFELLPQLVADLWLVFKERGQTDFIEIALKAGSALGEADDPSDLLLKLDQQLQHILIDEFQDTSRLQYQLFSTLTAGWTVGDGRTVFLVGDPMQSIYRFREAEVGLFLHCFNGRFGVAELPLLPLRLHCNFRSQQGIVSWVNRTFTTIFPERMDITTGAVPVAEAVAVNPLLEGPAVQVHPFAGDADQAEAVQVVKIIKQARAEDPGRTVAVLVRGRDHLRQILPLLRRHGIAYQARDINKLEASPSILDLVHLVCALVHRGDRLSWTAVLRAPWCGLSLSDLHVICTAADYRTIPSVIFDQQLDQELSPDGRDRLNRVRPILHKALTVRGQLPLRTLVEGCRLALGGLVGMSPADNADVESLFQLIEELERGGDLPEPDQLLKRLQLLFSAPDSRADGSVQIMTIHKAKGLQFDTVILPGLGKKIRKSEAALLTWLEHPRHGLLPAPITARGRNEKDPVFQLVTGIEAHKDDHESARLLYVAVTRAVRRLHLLGVAVDRDVGPQPAKGSLLEKLWPLLGPEFSLVSADVKQEKEVQQPPKMQRLPSHWILPETDAISISLFREQVTASMEEESESADELFSGWESAVFRHAGTLVHQLFERMVHQWESFQHNVNSPHWQQEIRRELHVLGVRQDDLEQGIDIVTAAVTAVLASARGRWLLMPHQDHASELSLTGMVDDRIVHAVIDRTFVEDGVRWVIDYKTSVPRQGELLADFLVREGQRYQRQLLTYLELMQHYDQHHPARGALYFPLVDGWYEPD